MSRFYRALQEASRTIPELAEEPAGGTAVGGDPEIDTAIGAPVFAGLAEALEASSQTGPGDENRPAPAVKSEALSIASPPNGEFGIAAQGVLDRAAPLIPNSIDPAVIESYGRLRAKIMQEQGRKPFRSLMITSPAPEDGKTVTALNLALSLAAVPSYRVLLVDGDLRRGTLGKVLGVGNPPGLGNLLEGSAQLKDVVLKSDDNPIYFMVRGSAAIPPAELLYSPRLIPQFRKMTEYFSMVLVDSPPVNLVADAQLLAAGCDAVLIVARAFATTRKGLQKAVQDLSHFRVIGTVLNRGMRADLYRHYKHY